MSPACTLLTQRACTNCPYRDLNQCFAVLFLYLLKGDHHAHHTAATLQKIAFRIFQLKSEITFTDHVQPVCLPKTDDVALAGSKDLWLTGWGVTTRECGSLAPNVVADMARGSLAPAVVAWHRLW